MGVPSCPTWTPILGRANDLTGSGWEAVGAVTEDMLRAGCLGAAPEGGGYEAPLLFGYRALADQSGNWFDETETYLNAAIDRSSSQPGPGLHGGLCGLGFVVEHLSRRFSGADDMPVAEESTATNKDLSFEVEAAVLAALRPEGWTGLPYDLMDGLVGFGLYFLERLPAGNSREGITLVLDRFTDLSSCAGIGIAWHTHPAFLPAWQREKYGEGYYDMGVARGIPGILSLLGEIAASPFERDRAMALLTSAMDWFLDQKHRYTKVSWFPSWIDGSSSQRDSGIAWCYGDLGIAAILLRLADRFNRADWKRFAQDMLDRCLACQIESSGVEDAALCHGAAGVAHIFNRIYQSCGDERCRSAALEWFRYVLDLRQPGEGVGGFVKTTSHDPDGRVVMEPDAALLDGATGVALALLGALTHVDPQWDRMMLLSGRFGR